MGAETPRVLLVEDDESTALLCSRTLGRHGWTCQRVGTVREAIDTLATEGGGIDLVILDYGLPDGQPWPVLMAAKTATPQIPVIMATGMGDEQVASECLRRGAADYIIKSGQFWDLLPPAAQRALRVTEAVQDASQLSAVVTASPDPVISTDPSGVIRTWNPAATRLYRYTPQAVIGRHLDLLAPEEAREQLRQQLTRVARGRRIRQEVSRQTADGERLVVSSAMSPIYGEDRTLIGIAVIEQDLRPRLEAARLQRLTGELEKLNRELDQFATVAAHDLQAPIRHASLALDMLAQTAAERLHDEERDLLRSAVDALSLSGEMVRKVLDYARQSTVELTADRVVDAYDACHMAVGNLEDLVSETGAEIEIDNLPTTFFDDTHLVRIFQNLLSNAMKYADPERPPRIKVRMVEDASPGFHAIEVRDNGMGMDEDELRRLFVIFQRGSSGSRREGNGIGLAVCKKLVEARGGSIAVSSTPGEGTTFRLELPSSNDRTEDDSSYSSGGYRSPVQQHRRVADG